MQKNESVTVTIQDMGVNGEGIGRVNGYTLFIKDAVIGDVVEARVTKAKKNYGYARLMNIITPSEHRVKPVCKFARKCGGCQIQEMSYEKQLEFKQNKVLGNLERIGGFSRELLSEVFGPIIGMEKPFGYRNKAQFPFGTDKNGQPITGFYAGRTHDIIANTDCALGVGVNREILEIVLAFMKKYGVRSYDEKTGEGLIRHVLIRYGFATKEIMVCVVVNRGKAEFGNCEELDCGNRGNRGTKGLERGSVMGLRWIPHQEVLVEELARIPGMTSITVSPNPRQTNVIMGERYEVLWGQPFITDYIGAVKYQISPLSFYQVNPVQTEKLYGLAMEYADLKGEETVWDLYCGIGTISLFLAQKAGKVYGVEIVPQAVEDARRNAEINGIENAEFYVGKAEEVLPGYYQRYEKEHPHADVIVVDPPRKGCDEGLLKTMADMRPERIVYVSCDSATLARDLRYLCERGYEVKKGRVVDQFGMSVHTESIVLLSKLHTKQNIEVELEMSEMDLTAAESKATYEEIKDYVLGHTRLKVSSLYIAQVKEKCGIIKRVNYNLPKSENSRQSKCPPEKEKAIRDALEYFRMI
ncbi:23S rRNA (uracil(1939)-C(5))-methyltransferase RlmD [Schaedlerella arabinosiphila]|uniref:23S rRNA (Uracil(1939)-C(5))-methyltransferase RlmD n=1 Tax=Schaedlerella arabinosiphila TaxID=2044587 RepID=A0A3R8KWV4_9FIRM|nr:23S rRNA (uracil(1939)-C(5))-methyltransferase RlmD [Schaedlerella arabinosiphila]RRK33543.1 23S rRNA (uracil(1939)-C(5))-methyltransferase RlmD [Schaedlerella arabinosiphila]